MADPAMADAHWAATLGQHSQPVLFKAVLRDWPVVQAARQSEAALCRFLQPLCDDTQVTLWRAPASAGGRFFYDEALDGFNFKAEHATLAQVLRQLQAAAGQAAPEALYVGSTTVEQVWPGFSAAHPLVLPTDTALKSLWLGNRTRIAAHQDLPDNLTCVAAGRRRFTLFPPEQLPNLYVGPLDFTPAGQPISLVDMAQPDLQRHPRFALAQQAAQVFELEPGDALFIPSMWWHQVEALDSINLLINYWWRSTPAFMDSPMGALMMALLSIRDLPPAQRQAWAAQFQHYVFEHQADSHAHIPPQALGVLGAMSPEVARPLRARLLKLLNR